MCLLFSKKGLGGCRTVEALFLLGEGGGRARVTDAFWLSWGDMALVAGAAWGRLKTILFRIAFTVYRSWDNTDGWR